MYPSVFENYLDRFLDYNQAMNTGSIHTLDAYRRDICEYFDFLMAEGIESLEDVDRKIVMNFISSLRMKDGQYGTLKNSTIARKLSSLRSFYRYFIQHEDIMYNPVDLVTMPKVHDKAITRLDIDEVALLLDQAESGDKLSEREQRFHDRTKLRDVALLTLMLGTGIRVSECVGLNIDDVDFKNDGIRIHRKGGKEVVVYFGDEVESALLSYIEERKKTEAVAGHEEALFLSLQKKRISVRAVEKLVKKYAQTVTTVKHITPHKLRSTYGTNLYRETGDIYLVADVLGHNDVNTTKKHYAALEDDRRRGARNAVKLRD